MDKKRSPCRRTCAAIALLTTLALTSCASVGQAPLPTAVQTPGQAAENAVIPAGLPAGSVTMEDANIEETDAYADWQSGAYTEIVLSATGYTISGQGASAEDTILTISAAGTYVLTGTMPNGAVVVDAEDDDEVRIVLNGASITAADGAPLFIKNADRVILSLAPGTENSLEDGVSYTYAPYDTAKEEPSAALFAKDDLIINGTGKLNVTANHNDGIAGNDDIKIVEGVLHIAAVDDGIVGRDMVAVETVDLTVQAGGDGIKSTNNSDTGKGFIAIEDGTFAITAGADGIQAQTELYIAGGEFDIVSGGGASSENTPQQTQGPGSRAQAKNASVDEDGSYKGLKAGSFLTIKDGSFTLDSADDALHTNGSMAISGGTLILLSGDDGLHADQSIAVSGGALTVSKSVEGIEAFVIDISGGTLTITASDDGLNVAGGNDSSGVQNGRDGFANLTGARFTISGGDITINAAGDGLDSNGSSYITGGTVYVSGPENSGNGALDYNGEFLITGGTLVALGSAGMAAVPSDGTTQPSIAGNLSAIQAAGSTLTLTNVDGEIIVSYPSPKTYQNIVISSPLLEQGKAYTLLVDGTAVQELTLNDTLTTFNLNSNTGGFGPGNGGGSGQGQAPGRGAPQQPGGAPPNPQQTTGGDA